MTPRNNFVLVSNRLPNLFARRPEMTLPLIPSGHAKPSGSSVRHFFPFFGVVLDWALPLRAAQEIFPKCSFRRSADPALDSIYAFAMKLGSLATRVTLYRVSVAQHGLPSISRILHEGYVLLALNSSVVRIICYERVKLGT